MRRRIVYAVLPWFVTAGCAAHHLGSTMVAGNAELVGPGVISTELPEFATTMTPDGHTLFFNRASADRSKLTIMMSSRRGEQWTVAVAAPFSGQYRDVDPFVMPDGRRLYFTSDRPRPGRPVSMNFWYVERTADGWSEPRDAGDPINSDSTDIFVSISRSGEMLFNSTRDGPRRVYQSSIRAGAWRGPVPVSFGSVIDAGNPMISPDGRYAILVRVAPGAKADLWTSCRTPDGWAEPQPLIAANSPYAEFAAGFGAGAHELYFTSERPGIVGALPDSIRPPSDLYRIRLEKGFPGCR